MDINKLIADYSKLGKDAYYKELEAKVNAVLPKIANYTLNIGDSKIHGVSLFANILIAMMGADGVIHGNEANFLTSLIQQVLDKSFTFDDALGQIGLSVIQREGVQNLADAVVDTLGQADSKLKEDIVTCCVLVALIDGNVSDGEKAFLTRLLA